MKLFSVVITFLICTQLTAQQDYWQQQLRYNISAELNDKDKTITGFESIVYKNNSTSTLDFIWFHLWPNAYKNDSTALLQQIIKDTTRSKNKEDRGIGFIDGLAFKVNGQPAKTEPHPNP